MNTARIVVLTIALGAGGVAVLAIGQAPKEKDGTDALVGETGLKPQQFIFLAAARQAGRLALRSIADVNAVELATSDQLGQGPGANVIRYGVASQATTQK